jgi:hypothetical protein
LPELPASQVTAAADRNGIPIRGTGGEEVMMGISDEREEETRNETNIDE